MAWVEPQFSKSLVDRAGRILAKRDDRSPTTTTELLEAVVVINNWRAAHNFPLNTFQTTLREKAERVKDWALVAQRLKRLSSIEKKLRDRPSMRLSQMDDVGGCRAIMRSTRGVDTLVNRYLRSGLQHKLHEQHDYISNPKPSGYRSHHLVYRYFSPRKTAFNDLRIEIQFRTRRQHTWATAVETVGIFTGQALKSSQGEGDWLRFFALMGGAIALGEHCAPVPNTPILPRELRDELRHYAAKLSVVSRLKGYASVIGQVTEEDHYVIVKLDAKNNQTELFGYGKTELEKATADYGVIESNLGDRGNVDAVLVSVSGIDNLRVAYPTYFLDSEDFIKEVKEATK